MAIPQYEGLTYDPKSSLMTGNNVYRDANGTLVRQMNRGSNVGSLWSAQGEYTPSSGGMSMNVSQQPAAVNQGGNQGGNLGLGGPTTSNGVTSSGTSNGMLSTVGQDPYLEQLKKNTTDTMTDAWNRSVLPGIQQGAVAAGGYGGSRQGVIEANAMNDLGKNIANAMTSIDSGAYNTALNYDLGLRNNNLGYYNAQNSYDLGLRNNQLGYGNLGLGYANLDRQINNDNFANQINGANMGLNIYDRLMGNNNTAINAGTNINNTPLGYWERLNNGVNGIANGYGTSSGSASNSGNPLLGAMGGMQLGGQVGQSLGNWWGSSGGHSTATGSNGAFMDNLAGMGVF